MSGKTEKEITAKLNFVFPKELKSYFSDNFAVQHQKDHFILSFYEVMHPVILGTEEERISQIKNMKEIDATCISRILVTPEKLKDIIKVLNENLATFEARKKEG